MRRNIAKELIVAARAMIDGIPSEDIDARMRFLINQLETATNRADEWLKHNFFITSVSKDDVLSATNDWTEEEKMDIQRNFGEDEMESIAEDMAGDYCNQLFWISLRTIVKDKYL
jgi:hypothetical protein